MAVLRPEANSFLLKRGEFEGGGLRILPEGRLADDGKRFDALDVAMIPRSFRRKLGGSWRGAGRGTRVLKAGWRISLLSSFKEPP